LSENPHHTHIHKPFLSANNIHNHNRIFILIETSQKVFNTKKEIIIMIEEKFQLILQELVRRTNEESRRLRVLEQRVQALEERMSSFEDANLNRTKKLNEKIKMIDSQINNLNDDMLKIKTNLEKINRQMVDVARRKDLMEIERMFELLTPVKNNFYVETQSK